MAEWERGLTGNAATDVRRSVAHNDNPHRLASRIYAAVVVPHLPGLTADFSTFSVFWIYRSLNKQQHLPTFRRERDDPGWTCTTWHYRFLRARREGAPRPASRMEARTRSAGGPTRLVPGRETRMHCA
eukprot:7378874-Prymnesium_polylepis.1